MGNVAKIVLTGLLVVVIVLGFYFYTAEGSIRGPEQPVLFSHKIHAGENQIACTYCHSYVAESSWAGIPSVQKCMGCHAHVAGRDIEYEYNGETINIQEELKKFKDNYGTKNIPIPWTKVYYLPDHAHFVHSRHIRRGFECKMCHGEVQNMDAVYRVQDLKMGWCVSCHEANARDENELALLKDCFTCHY